MSRAVCASLAVEMVVSKHCAYLKTKGPEGPFFYALTLIVCAAVYALAISAAPLMWAAG